MNAEMRPEEQSVFSCDAATAQSALDILRQSPGLMVRQPLSRHNHPLQFCDYHDIAAPFRSQVTLPAGTWGRGAAGRPATKYAFMAALEHYIPQAAEAEKRARTRQPLQEFRTVALDAFRDDFTYFGAMAATAMQLLRRSGARSQAITAA
jgi:hypothetical protein